ncbi:MAG: transglutaminase family protein [Myxococcales bacterium]
MSRFLVLQGTALFGAAAAAFASVAVSRALPTFALAAFSAVWFLGLFVRERASRGPANAVNLVTVGAVLWILLPAFAVRESLPVAAAETALVLCGNRLLVRRSAADDGMLHLSCWLVLASGASLTGELVYGLCLLAYAALASTSMMLAELRRGIEEEAGFAGQGNGGPQIRRSPRAETDAGGRSIRSGEGPEHAHALLAAPELTSNRLLAFSASLGLFSAGFGVLVFPLFPRAQLGLFGRLGGRPGTGVGDRVDLSGQGTLADSSRLVLQAELTGDRSAARYWRALTLERFTGRGWTHEESAAEALRGIDEPGKAAVAGTFVLFPDTSRRVPVPEGLLRLWPDPPVIRLREDENGDIRLGLAAPEHEDFRFEASPAPGPEPDRQAVARALELPELSPAVRTLARSLVPDGTPAEEAVRRVTGYLDGFAYSRELHQSTTPLEDFLTRRSGHCELFATAVAVLLRARGVPARYVAGYYASDLAADPLTLRDWDAHAWAEVLLPGRGFVPVDATPVDLRGSRLAHARLWERILDLWDGAQLRWLHGIVDFDSRAQVHSAGVIARAIERGAEALLHPSPGALRTSFALLLLALLGFAVLRRPRRAPPAVRLEHALFAALARRGVERGVSETYEEALARLRVRDPRAAETAAALLSRIGAARFGGRPLLPGEPAALRSRLARL